MCKLSLLYACSAHTHIHIHKHKHNFIACIGVCVCVYVYKNVSKLRLHSLLEKKKIKAVTILRQMM